MTVGRVPTVGAALHTIHCIERGVEAATAGGASTLSLVLVGGSRKRPDACRTAFPTFRSIPRYPSTGRTDARVSARPGRSGPPCASGGRELTVDAGEKYAGECSVDCCAASGRLFDGVVIYFSPPVVCVAYLGISPYSVGGGDYHSRFLNGKTSCVTRGMPWTRNPFRNRTRRSRISPATYHIRERYSDSHYPVRGHQIGR